MVSKPSQLRLKNRLPAQKAEKLSLMKIFLTCHCLKIPGRSSYELGSIKPFDKRTYAWSSEQLAAPADSVHRKQPQ